MIANWKSAGRIAFISALLLLIAACGGNEKASPTSETSQPEGIHKIQHVVMIMQENRSFDHYFGTFPGAEGIPMQDGVPTVCAPDPRTNQCVKPYHDPDDLNYGGPHEASAAVADIDGGKMDGFIDQQITGGTGGACAIFPNNPNCGVTPATPDVMGYHDAREIPNYWTYAEQFVLQDHMFEPNASWSLPAHLFMVSEWSAQCSRADNPSTASTR